MSSDVLASETLHDLPRDSPRDGRGCVRYFWQHSWSYMGRELPRASNFDVR